MRSLLINGCISRANNNLFSQTQVEFGFGICPDEGFPADIIWISGN